MSQRLVFINKNADVSYNTFEKLHSFKGGSIYIDCLSASIQNNAFIENKATYAGAIMITAPSYLSINSNSFCYNKADVLAGAVLCESSVSEAISYIFTGNNFSKNTSPSVSALDIWDCFPIVTNSVFDSNYATFKYGSLRTSSKSPKYATVGECKFINNKSPELGAAYSVFWFASTSRILNCSFYHSSTIKSNGFSIYSSNNAVNVSILGCSFEYSQEEEIIITKQSSTVEIDNCKFSLSISS